MSLFDTTGEALDRSYSYTKRIKRAEAVSDLLASLVLRANSNFKS